MRVKVLLVFALLSCSEEPSDESAAQLWCSGNCAAVDRCFDVPDCNGDCIAHRPGLANYSAEGAAALEPCLASMSCTELAYEESWDKAYDRCWDAARDSLEPRPSVRTFCVDWVEAWFECGFWYSTTECEKEFGMFADSRLDRLARCERLSCVELDACATAEFER